MTDDHNIGDMLEHIPTLILEEENHIPIRPIEATEVFASIWSLGLDKAHGPDGFPISFYRHFWDLIKSNLLRMLHYFDRNFRSGGIPIHHF